MKNVVVAALIGSILLPSAAFAQSRPYNPNNGHHHSQRHAPIPHHYQKPGHHVSKQKAPRWARGKALPREYRRNVVRSNDYRRHGLRQPPRGYQWVRVDNQYLMIAAATGLISSIIAGAR